MRVKRAFGVLAAAIAMGGVGSAVIVGTSAAGSPSQPTTPVAPFSSVSVAPPTHVVPQSQAAPKTSLHLPTTIHLIDRTASTVTVNSSHLVISASLSKRTKAAGHAIYTCTLSGGQVTQCLSAVALSGGILLAKLSPQSNGVLSGPITAGSGSYAGASGTITATPKSPGKASLTISYSLD